MTVKIDSGISWIPVKAKRVKKNIENLVKFFSSKDKFGYPREEILKMGSSHTIVELIRLYDTHSHEMDELIRYVRKYRLASSQITVEDLDEAKKLISIEDVMGS